MSSILAALFVPFALITFTSSAFAAPPPSCVQNATDEELLNEISTRLRGGGTSPVDGAIPSFSCRFQDLTISLVDATTGNERREQWTLSDPNSCTALERTLGSKLSNRALLRSVVVAGCNFQTLLRVSMSSAGHLQRLQNQDLSSPAACATARDQINNAL